MGMASSCEGKTRGAYRFAIAVILAWLGGKVVVLEEGLETNGVELDDGEYGWWITSLGDWIVVDIIGEVVVKEGVFTMSEVCAETLGEIVVRADISTNCWM